MSDVAALRLVRVQSDFQGIAVEDDGTLSLYRYGDNIRNTMHFSVSGVVASHEIDEDFQGFPCALPPRCPGAALDAFREARMAGRADSRHDDTQFSTLPRMRG